MAKILVVDDEEIMRSLVVDTLELQNHTLKACCDGADGLSALAGFDPDLVISDFKMPGMTGVEFLKEVRSRRKTQPFLLMTAHGTIEMDVDEIAQFRIAHDK